MAFVQQDNSGALFKNDRKEAENHPDYTGTAKINGVEMEIGAWIRKSQAGKTFMGLKFTPKQLAQQPAPPAAPDFDDDIPF